MLTFLPRGVYSFILVTQRILSHAMSINTRENQKSESRDSAKVCPRVDDLNVAQGGVEVR